MQKKNVQMSPFDLCNDVSEAVENKNPKVIALLEKHTAFEKLIHLNFYILENADANIGSIT